MVLERVVSQPIQKKPRPGCVFGELLGTSAEVLVQLLVDLFLQGAPEGPHHEPQPHLHLHKVVADGQPTSVSLVAADSMQSGTKYG